eukprot:scaffold38550_cov47-Phaeocystis_antarctica.AAC.1
MLTPTLTPTLTCRREGRGQHDGSHVGEQGGPHGGEGVGLGLGLGLALMCASKGGHTRGGDAALTLTLTLSLTLNHPHPHLMTLTIRWRRCCSTTAPRSAAAAPQSWPCSSPLTRISWEAWPRHRCAAIGTLPWPQPPSLILSLFTITGAAALPSLASGHPLRQRLQRGHGLLHPRGGRRGRGADGGSGGSSAPAGPPRRLCSRASHQASLQRPALRRRPPSPLRTAAARDRRVHPKRRVRAGP